MPGTSFHKSSFSFLRKNKIKLKFSVPSHFVFLKHVECLCWCCSASAVGAQLWRRSFCRISSCQSSRRQWTLFPVIPATDYHILYSLSFFSFFPFLSFPSSLLAIVYDSHVHGYVLWFGYAKIRVRDASSGNISPLL